LEFKRLTAGIAPIAEQQKLIYILKKIEPIYDEIVWNKSTHNLKKHIQMLPVLSKKYFLYEKIKNIQSFYNTVWDPEIPIIASYYPIPAKDGNPSSTIKGNTLLCGILTDTYDYDFTFSVTFHEMSHMFFREQSPEFQHKIDQYYLQASSKHKMFALQLLDEGLATAIGSWIHELITGQTDFSYNDYYINNYAKAIYPLLKSYIENGKSMDEYFIQESIKICEEIFPQAIYEYDNCFRDFYMLTDVDGGKRRPLIQILRKYLKSKNYRYQFETPIIHEKYIKEIAESNTTKFILITQEHNTTFQYLKDFISELKDFKGIDTHSDFILSFLGDGGFAYIIVNLHDIDKFETMIMNMKEKQYIQLNAPIITIK